MRQFAQHFSSLFPIRKMAFSLVWGQAREKALGTRLLTLLSPSAGVEQDFTSATFFCTIFLPTTISKVEARFHSAIVSYIVPNVATCCRYISIRHGWGLHSGLHAEICHTMPFFSMWGVLYTNVETWAKKSGEQLR